MTDNEIYLTRQLVKFMLEETPHSLVKEFMNQNSTTDEEVRKLKDKLLGELKRVA